MAPTRGGTRVKPTTQQGVDDAFDNNLKAEETAGAADGRPTLTYERVKQALTRAYEISVVNGDDLPAFVKILLATADRRFVDDPENHRLFRTCS